MSEPELSDIVLVPRDQPLRTRAHNGLSILSYNILLPNSLDGWWVYKMYSHRHQLDEAATAWVRRQELIKRDISQADCDIVCLQEVCADSFKEDFAFMRELGYDGSEIYRKGRFRPATFWKSTRVEPVAQANHRDRCLLMAFTRRENGETTAASVSASVVLETATSSSAPSSSASAMSSSSSSSCNSSSSSSDELSPLEEVMSSIPLYVTNCHLQAGAANAVTAERQLRQIHDCLDTIRKDATKLITSRISMLNKRCKMFSKKSNKKAPVDVDVSAAKKEANETFTITATTTTTTATATASSSTTTTSTANAVGIDVTIPTLETCLTKVPIIILGDMNSAPIDSSAAHALLMYGEASVKGRVASQHSTAASTVLPTTDLATAVNGYSSSSSSNNSSSSKSTLKIKKHMFGCFLDAYASAYAHHALSEPPPTMVVEELYGVLTVPVQSSICSSSSSSGTGSQDAEEKEQEIAVAACRSDCSAETEVLSPLAHQLLYSMFTSFATGTAGAGGGEPVMTAEDVKRWLVKINKKIDRGSEMRAAVKFMLANSLSAPVTDSSRSNPAPNDTATSVSSTSAAAKDDDEIGEEYDKTTASADTATMNTIIPEEGNLHWVDFLSIYSEMITEGKVWGVSWDLAACGYPLPITSRVFAARFDRAYISGGCTRRSAIKQSSGSKSWDKRNGGSRMNNSGERNNGMLVAVRDLQCGPIEEGCPGVGGCLPNAHHPSDHLPIGIVIEF